MAARPPHVPLLARARRCAERAITPTAVLLAAAALTGSAHGQMAPGDLVFTVNDFTPRVVCLRPDGTLRWVVMGSNGDDWVGSTVTPLGHVVVSRTSPTRGINVYDANGVQIHSFATPQIQSAADISIFSDGVFAISDFGKVELYTESGSYLGPLIPVSADRPYGSHVDRNDHLFVCDLGGGSVPSRIFELDRAGQTLATIPLTFIPGDVVAVGDGTLWVNDVNACNLVRIDGTGAVLESLNMPFGGTFYGLAEANDGTLWMAGSAGPRIYHWTPTTFGYIPIPGLNNYSLKKFLTVVPCGAVPLAYCQAKTNSIGCVPAIGSAGLPNAVSSTGFTVSAANVRNQKPGLLLYGISGASNQPFQGGTLCVASPVRRTTPVSSGGSPLPANDCSGIYSIDMNAFGQGALGGSPLPALKVPGTAVSCQWWGRDPGFPPPNATTLSAGLAYTICGV